MPDHEEAVREAYDEWRGSQSGMPSPRRSFEAGAASERAKFEMQIPDGLLIDAAVREDALRAKYAALVEAAKKVVYSWVRGGEDDMADAVFEVTSAVAALQSKEGTNE